MELEEEEEDVEREVRSLRMALDWRRAELKRVFCLENGLVIGKGGKVCMFVSTMAVYRSSDAQSDSNICGNERRCAKYVQ